MNTQPQITEADRKCWLKDTARAIPGYPRYFITSTGEVFSEAKGSRRAIKLNIDNYGYPYFVPSFNGKQRRLRTGVAVALTFIGPRPSPSHELCHINDVKTDNCLANLMWGTRETNVFQRGINGGTLRGERAVRSKLKNKDVLAMRERASRGERICALAREYGISRGHASEIVAKKKWRFV